MNKLIIGLFCLGVLSAVSCDNESNEATVTTPLKEVNFLANEIDNVAVNDGNTPVTFEAGDKIKLYIVEGDNTSTTAAKYYTEENLRQIAKEFNKDGTEFSFVKKGNNVVIKNGFYLESADGNGKKYTIKKFDIIKKEDNKDIDQPKDYKVSYVLNKHIKFSVKENGDNKFDVDVVEKKETTISGDILPKKGKSVTLGAKAITINPHQFKLMFRKSDGTSINSFTNKDDLVHFTVKDGNAEIYNIANLFKISGFKNYSAVFTITLPRELDYYQDLTIEGTFMPKYDNQENRNLYKFVIEKGSIKEGIVVLRANAPPIIELKDGIKVLDVSKNTSVKVINITDAFGGKVNHTYEAKLYKNSKFLKSIKNAIGKQGVINPYNIGYNTSGDPKYLRDLKNTELSNYTLKVTATADDGVAKVEKTFEFTFKNSSSKESTS